MGSSHHLVPTDSPELHDAVFVVGALDETIMLRGMRYHPIDIENSVLRCHKKIAEWYVILFYIRSKIGNISFFFQCRFHLDELTSGGSRIRRQRKRSLRPGAASYQHRARGAPPHRRRRSGRGPWRSADQFARRETADAPARRLLSRPARSHLRGVQHVTQSPRFLYETQQETTQVEADVCLGKGTNVDFCYFRSKV